MTATIVTILIIAGSAYLIFRLRKIAPLKAIWRDLDGIGIPKSKARFKFDYVTPRGVRVKSTVEVPAEALARIDAGYADGLAYRNEFFPYWTKGSDPKEFPVLFVDPMATNVETDPGSPALLIRGQQSAGTNIGFAPFPASKQGYIVLPHQADTNWTHLDYLQASANNERSHGDEWLNEFKVWEYFTGVDDTHPHRYDIVKAVLGL